jgi:CBS-domain-containing membrane protein
MTERNEALIAEARRAEARSIERLLRESTTCETWMTPWPHTVSPSDSLDHARKLVRLHRINQLPVVGRGGKKLLGIVTDRDLRKAVGPSFANLSVESVMSRPAITLARHSTLINAAEIMRISRIGSVPIAEGEAPVGIVTRSDILEAFVAFSQGRYRRIAAPRGKRSENEDATGVLKPGSVGLDSRMQRSAKEPAVNNRRMGQRAK